MQDENYELKEQMKIIVQQSVQKRFMDEINETNSIQKLNN